MSDRPLIIDLFSCAGGAAMGYHRAGFDVVGVDIVDRPNYPFTFVKADALDVLTNIVSGYWGLRPDAVHASPPCQKRNPLTKGTNRLTHEHLHHDFVPGTRTLLEASGLPYVIEQPAGSKAIREDLMLCMDMFKSGPPPWGFRHRVFEISGFTVPPPAHHRHSGRVRGWRHGVKYAGDYVAAYGRDGKGLHSGGGKATVAEMQHAMGIGWTSVREELTEAIPPAYTEYIGRALMSRVRAA